MSIIEDSQKKAVNAGKAAELDQIKHDDMVNRIRQQGQLEGLSSVAYNGPGNLVNGFNAPNAAYIQNQIDSRQMDSYNPDRAAAEYAQAQYEANNAPVQHSVVPDMQVGHNGLSTIGASNAQLPAILAEIRYNNAHGIK